LKKQSSSLRAGRKADMKKAIETYWDPDGFRGGKRGCWCARMQDLHGLHSAGMTAGEAVRDLLLTAKSHDLSGDREDYDVVDRPNWTCTEGCLPPLKIV